MNCDQTRLALSATADGEADGDERRRMDAHIDTCPSCQGYAARLSEVDRLVRVRPAEAVPDLVAAVTASSRPAHLGRGGWLRPALAWVAVVLAVQNLPALVFGNTSGTEEHLSRHLGAFGVALAIGFAFIAWRPHRAIGLLPLVAALVTTMIASATFDLLDGGRSALAETAHISELIGLALLWMIAGSPGWHGLPRRDPRPSGAAAPH